MAWTREEAKGVPAESLMGPEADMDEPQAAKDEDGTTSPSLVPYALSDEEDGEEQGVSGMPSNARNWGDSGMSTPHLE